MWNPLLPDLARLQQEQGWQEAGRRQASRDMRVIDPGAGASLALGLGDLLIAAGLRLRRRYSVATCAGPEIRRSGC